MIWNNHENKGAQGPNQGIVGTQSDGKTWILNEDLFDWMISTH